MTQPQMTICSNMHCYNEAEVTNDPLHPPFCQPCKDKKKPKPKEDKN
jgi:hypothetical protein